MSKTDTQMNLKDFMIGAAFGVALGATLAYLTAPKAGKEVRDDINKKFNYVRDKGQKIVLDVKTQSTDMIGKMAEVKDKVQNKLTSIKENIGEGVTEFTLKEEAEEDKDIYTVN
ncbi:YtxH domain-containing protein [Shimazuella sp. AN120528]|uniref:YtxH domain-containing protein n=1 Tax=Shimazuella soli TaxID=1892854 RepID=UPI001F10C407|nr:YtxH domain-containing protein [Shimazuella soli]MCH5583544.1 YtxH domain-containing protein [Shimazuella soli]